MMVTSANAQLLDAGLSKIELLRSIDDSYAALRGELRRDRRASGGWSPVDHVAHLAAWEAVALARVEGRRGGAEAAGLFWQAGRRLLGVSTPRGRCYRVEAGVERLGELHGRLMRALWDLPEAALRRPWHPAYPTTLAADLVRNTRRHYEAHVAAIRGAG